MAPPSSRKPPEAPSKEKNEYIPNFISKRPIWLEPTSSLPDDSPTASATSTILRRSSKATNSQPTQDPSGDYLAHQRSSATFTETSWYDRSKRHLKPAATKYRKGACENCGAMGHKARECLQKKRKTGAKWSGRDIQQDERAQEVRMGWDAKRDRWNGYQPEEYDEVVKEFQDLEELKGSDTDEKYGEETDMGRNQSNSTRQLRIREDTAKYLVNLDLDSARYDPKTRSMIDGGAMQDESSKLVEEEGFVRASGDAGEFAEAQRYAWEVQEGRITPNLGNGPSSAPVQMHLQANPTEGAMVRKKALAEAAKRKEEQRKALVEKYGQDPSATAKRPPEIEVKESNQFVEYDEDGEVKGTVKTTAKSQYPEDIMIGNHTKVWGSFWEDLKWGYACCQQFEKRSYCTGAKGIEAKRESERWKQAEIEKLKQEAVDKEADKENADGSEPGEGRKRTLLEMTQGVDEKEIDEYAKRKMLRNDPMAAYLGAD